MRAKPNLPAGVTLRANVARRHTTSLADAVKVLRIHEKAAEENKRELNDQETAIVHQMCQVRGGFVGSNLFFLKMGSLDFGHKKVQSLLYEEHLE